MKTVLKIILFAFLMISLERCSTAEPEYSEIRFATGVVKYISLEGGFYGIITDDKKYLDPLNLSKEFQVDGMKVFVKYRSKLEGASFHMWGEIIEIVEIRELK